MTAVAIGPLAAGNYARYATLAATLALLTGALAVLASLVRLGFVADLLSRPVVVGYLAGVALVMIAGQLGRLTDVRISGESFVSQVASFARQAAHVTPGDTVIAAVVVVFLFWTHAQWPRFPGPLAAVSQASPPARWFVLNTEANVEVDYTALEAVEAVRAELASRGVVVALARVKQDLLDDLQAFGLAQKISPQRIFPTLPTAVAAYREWASQHPLPGPENPA
jgi:MFS superfamily sulfate permease-like transporter